jgi:hypothetical protein
VLSYLRHEAHYLTKSWNLGRVILMADVQCGKFELVRQDLQTGNLTFRAKLTPPPTAQWTAVFHEYQGTERGVGNLAVARIEGDVIEFEVPESSSEAAASVIRRCVQRTNPEAAKRQAAQQKQSEAWKKRVEDELKRVREKFRNGI